MTDDDHRQRAGSSPGEGSPLGRARSSGGSPDGRSSTITRPPELVASRAGDLTPWSAGGSWRDSTGAPSSLWADSGRSPAGQGESRHRSREVERWLPRRIGHSFTLSRRMERTPCRHPPRAQGGDILRSHAAALPGGSRERRGEDRLRGERPAVPHHDLAAALAQLVRAALARRAECPEKAA